MKLFLLLTLIFGSAIAVPTLEHILGLKEGIREFFHGGGHNREHGYGRGYGHPHGHPHGHGHAGYALGSGKNENSQVVYIHNGQTQQHSANGYTTGGAGQDFNGYGNSHLSPYVGSPVGQHVGMYPQRPHFGTTQSTANAISSSWSNSVAGSSGFHGNGGGSTAQSSAAASSSSSAGFA